MLDEQHTFAAHSLVVVDAVVGAVVAGVVVDEKLFGFVVAAAADCVDNIFLVPASLCPVLEFLFSRLILVMDQLPGRPFVIYFSYVLFGFDSLFVEKGPNINNILALLV